MNSITRKFIPLLLLSGVGYSMSAMNREKDFGSQLLESNRETGFFPALLFKAASSSLTCATCSPDGETILTGSEDGRARLWDFKTGALIRTLEGHTRRINAVAFNADGETILTGSEDGYAQLWNSKTGDLIRTFASEAAEPILSVAFSPDRETIVTGPRHGALRLWNIQTGEIVKTIKQDRAIPSLAFSPDGETIFTGSSDGYARLWNSKTGDLITVCDRRPVSEFFQQFAPAWINSVAFSPDGDTVLAGSDDPIICIWSSKTGKLIRTLNGNKGRVNSVTFSSDGKIILIGTFDGTARLWNSKTGELLTTLHVIFDICSVAFSPDEKSILIGLKKGEVCIMENSLKNWTKA